MEYSNETLAGWCVRVPVSVKEPSGQSDDDGD